MSDRKAAATLGLAPNWRALKRLVYRDASLAAAERYLELDPQDVLLDVGGGGGYYLARLAPRVRLAVLVDRFAGMYAGGRDVARRAGHDADLQIVCGDAHALPFATAAASKMLCNQVIEHLEDPAEFLAGAARTLRPGGVLVLISQNAAFLAGYRFPVRRTLVRVLPAGWRDGNSYLRHGYEGWEREVGHLHRFTRDDYSRWATAAGLEVRRIVTMHGWWSMLTWECEATVLHRARLGFMVRIAARALLRPLTRLADRLTGCREGLDLIGVFRRPPDPA